MLVTRFVKDVFERRPSLPRYKEIWDINSVLKVLATWNLGVDVSLRDMSWKLTMLLALLSSQRVQTLKALTLTSMTLIANNCVFTIETLLGRASNQVELKFWHTGLTGTCVLYNICKPISMEHLT